MIDSHHQLICSASTIFGTLALNGLSDTHVYLQYSTDFLKTSCFLMYFRKYRKRPVSWNGLKICLTNTSAECLYSCLFHNRACFITVDQHWFYQWTQELYSFSVFWYKLISRNSSRGLLWVDVYGNQLKQ